VRPSPTYVRIGTGIVVLAVIAVVLLLRVPGDEPDDPAPEATPRATPTAPPSSVSAEEFCAAFTVMAAAHSNHLANDTELSGAELAAAAENLLRLEPGTVMPPAARQGLKELVAGVLGESTAAPDQAAADALSGFLEVSCPAGAR
jgi:hypothetical protein